MASFTDAIPQFNPYISQLPVEEMAKVGMQKQEQYNQGIQKIQSNVDNISGLDVIRNVDKKYLNSQLNSLGNQLKTVAAGDFSNFQLVNSVSGMTNKIAKDKNVLNAVSSTMKYRKEVANLEKAKSEGKSSIANEWVFNQESNNWINSENLQEGFNTKYTPYVDVQKKWLEVFKGLHSDLIEQDIPWVKDINGNINYNQTAVAMQRISKESVSKEKIENALRYSLSPDEMNQLSINGRFEFREYDTPEKLSIYSKTKYSKQLNLIENDLKDLKAQAVQYESNPAKKEQYDNSIKYLEQKQSSLPKLLNDELQLIQENPEQFKAHIYKEGAIEQFVNTYSWEHQKLNYVNNPFQDQKNWEKNFNQRVYEQQYKERRDLLNDRKEAEKERKENEINQPFVVSGAVSTKAKDPYVAYNDEMFSYQDNAKSIFNQIVEAYAKNGGIDNKTAAKHVAYNLEQYRNGDITKLKGKYHYLADQWKKAQNTADFMQSVIDEKRKEVENSPEILEATNELNNELRNVNNGVGIAIINDSSQEYIEFSNEELLNYLNKEHVTNATAAGAPVGGYNLPVITFDELTNKEKILNNYLNKLNKSKSLNESQKLVKERLNNVRQISNKNSKVITNIHQQLKEKLTPITAAWTPTQSLLDNTSSEKDKKYRGFIQGVITKFTNDSYIMNADFKGGDEALSDNEIETLNSWLTQTGNMSYHLIESGDKNYLAVKNGTSTVEIPLTQSEYQQFPKGSNTHTFEEKRIRGLRDAKGTTNAGGPSRGMFDRQNMPNVRVLDIKADFEKALGRPISADNIITYHLNISEDPENPEWISTSTPENIPQSIRTSQQILNQSTDTQILEMFLGNPQKGYNSQVNDSQREKIIKKYLSN